MRQRHTKSPRARLGRAARGWFGYWAELPHLAHADRKGLEKEGVVVPPAERLEDWFAAMTLLLGGGMMLGLALVNPAEAGWQGAIALAAVLLAEAWNRRTLGLRGGWLCGLAGAALAGMGAAVALGLAWPVGLMAVAALSLRLAWAAGRFLSKPAAEPAG